MIHCMILSIFPHTQFTVDNIVYCGKFVTVDKRVTLLALRVFLKNSKCRHVSPLKCRQGLAGLLTNFLKYFLIDDQLNTTSHPIVDGTNHSCIA